MFDLTGKTALVTGAGSGIGEAIARRLAAAGAKVVVVELKADEGKRVAAAIAAAGGSSEVESLDVSDPSATEDLGKRIGRIDTLVNNAGIGHVGDLFGTEAADLDRLHAVNVRGPFNLCKAFVPAMIAAGSGSVINIASIGGVLAVRDRLAYTTSKHALVGLTRALALDHSESGVRFNAICPGRVETAFVKSMISRYPDPAAAYREMASTQLNGRMATPEEIAALAHYLASDEAAMVTGSCQLIDGGWSAGK